MIEKSRRELMKMFGIGTVIAPIIGGAAELSTPARLIEVPNVEAVTLPISSAPLDAKAINAIEVTVTLKDGTRRTLHGTRITWLNPQRPVVPGDILDVAVDVDTIIEGRHSSPRNYWKNFKASTEAVLL